MKGAEFDVYEKYMDDIMKLNVIDRLYALLKREDLSKKLCEYDPNFKDVVKYLLPTLLEGPIYHLKYCFDVFDVSFAHGNPKSLVIMSLSSTGLAHSNVTFVFSASAGKIQI